VENNATQTQGSAPESGTASGLMDQARSTATQVVQQTQEQAGDLLDRARDQFSTQVSGQKDAVADSAGSLATALRQTSQQLNDQGQGMVGQFVDRAAELADGVSGYLRERSVGDLTGELENFARREPVLFLGGAFALGFMAARFLKSSGPGTSLARPETVRPYHSYSSIPGSQSLGSSLGRPLGSAVDAGGPIETAGGSVWTGNGPDADPRGQRVFTGGERDTTTGAAQSDMDEDDTFELTSSSNQGRG